MLTDAACPTLAILLAFSSFHEQSFRKTQNFSLIGSIYSWALSSFHFRMTYAILWVLLQTYETSF